MVDEQVLLSAPRVIATTEERVLMAAGDRVYVRGDAASPMLAEAGEPRYYRVFRNAVALKDPVTAEVLGYEAQYLGKAELVRGESFEEIPNGKGGYTAEYVPARGAVISVAPVRPACKESISSCTAAISVLISWLEV